MDTGSENFNEFTPRIQKERRPAKQRRLPTSIGDTIPLPPRTFILLKGV